MLAILLVYYFYYTVSSRINNMFDDHGAGLAPDLAYAINGVLGAYAGAYAMHPPGPGVAH